MSTVIQTSGSWPGFIGLKRLIIFGDSYSDVGYHAGRPHPTEENPLGVEFPGTTWAEEGEPNWVGHLITNYPPAPLLVYDLAHGGDTIAGVRAQVERGFLRQLVDKPYWCQWNANDTLFVTWVGINDCAFATETTIPNFIDKLFDLQEQLYEAGARSFLLIDVPPVHRSPAGRKASSTVPGKGPSVRLELWNKLLLESAQHFASKHDQATVLYFSSWTTFSRVMDDPVSYGFTQEDTEVPASRMWVDFLHPTSDMHDIIARDVADFLTGIVPHKASQAPSE
ncbi:SGNH hydrolase-type esterase domain-containing protein [Fomitopsis serialis]|uniref:SGNH hydrolase-type esterase domain-containing protein n=1 Tax=Fomitopsis serialis TaxID=139415 RepID=UPI002007F3B9|nr:SGNH hydrolase-type esterase domain-containing protein [Neoantrodia serialis]KAH9935010.1 SGNH hydrolase-type esterase domain-containing protein [Neoantrodia serialis]